MQIFCPYPSPIATARCLSRKHLNNQCNEARVVLDAINGGEAWAHHPVVVMYNEHWRWLIHYRSCLIEYKNGDMDAAELLSRLADEETPEFLTDGFCENMRRRLYTKNPEHYGQFFGELEPTEENWYWSPYGGKIIRYRGGKRLE